MRRQNSDWYFSSNLLTLPFLVFSAVFGVYSQRTTLPLSHSLFHSPFLPFPLSLTHFLSLARTTKLHVLRRPVIRDHCMFGSINLNWTVWLRTSHASPHFADSTDGSTTTRNRSDQVTGNCIPVRCNLISGYATGEGCIYLQVIYLLH